MEKRTFDLNKFRWSQVYQIDQVVLSLSLGEPKILRVTAPDFHTQDYDANWAWEASGMAEYMNTKNKRAVWVLEWLINNAHFPYPVEEMI